MQDQVRTKLHSRRGFLAAAAGLIAVNALNCNNIEILNDLVDVVGVGLNSR